MENSNNNVPDYPPVSKNGIGSSFPSRKTVTIPQSPLFSLFHNQEYKNYSSQLPGHSKEDISRIMYNNFQNDKELQRKYKHLYEIEKSQENRTAHLVSKLRNEVSSNGDSISGRSHVTTPTFVQVPVKSLSYQMRIHLLEEILSYVQTSKSYHISWSDICNRMAMAYHITISPEEAKSVWDSIAYGSTHTNDLKENESDDEHIFQTEGKPFHLEQYFKRHYKQGSDVNRTTLLSVDYPDTISDECDMISIQRNCPLSIIPLRNYSGDNSPTTPPINKLDNVLEMISKLFSISVADIRSLWGTDRIKELEAVLNDIDLLSAESQQQHFVNSQRSF